MLDIKQVTTLYHCFDSLQVLLCLVVAIVIIHYSIYPGYSAVVLSRIMTVSWILGVWAGLMDFCVESAEQMKIGNAPVACTDEEQWCIC